MEKGVSKKFLRLSIMVIGFVVLIAIILLIVGIVNYSGRKGNTAKEETNTSTRKISTNGEKMQLTDEEITEINDYFNSVFTSQLIFAKFDAPKSLLSNQSEENFAFITSVLSYSVEAHQLTEDDNTNRTISLSGIKKTLKGLTNYKFSDKEIKPYFSSIYNKEKDLYVIKDVRAMITGKATADYRIDNYYYVTFPNDINVVLQWKDNHYYFYSSTGFNTKNN